MSTDLSPAPSATVEENPAPAGGTGGTPDEVAHRKAVVARLVDILPVAALAALVLFFGIRTDAFLSSANLTLLSGQAGVLLLVSLGATLVVLAGSVDLSTGAVVLLTSAAVGKMLAGGVTSVWLALLATLAVGVAAGTLNGAVFAYGRVSSFITTLGSMSVFSGSALLLIGGASVPFVAPDVEWLSTGQLIPDVQNSGLIALVALAVVWVVSRRTALGMYIYAIGSNEEVVRLAGVKVSRVKALTMVFSGVTAALAGLLLAGQLSAAGPSIGSSALLDSVAAIAVGGTSLAGGKGGVHRTLLGVLLLVVLSNGLNQLGVQSFTQTIIKGLVIIVAVVFTTASQRTSIVK